MADQSLAFPELGHARPKSGDPRLPPLKSALQKYVRRGEVTKAVAVAHEMCQIPGGIEAVIRRLPVIAAEDVGYWAVPITMQLDRAPEQPVLDVVSVLAANPKSKEAYWLANASWLGRTPVHEVSAAALFDALTAADYRGATAMLIVADEDPTSPAPAHGKGGITTVLHRLAEESLPDAAARVVKASLARTARGGAGELFATAVIAAIDKPEQLPDLIQPDWELKERPHPLDWYTQDGHTKLGQIGLRIVVKRQGGISYESLAELMFNFESIVMGPVEVPDDRWKDVSLGYDVEQHGWGSVDRAQWMWTVLRPDVKSAIEWIQRKEAERGGLV